MKRFVLTPHARRDVNDIRDCIANDNIEPPTMWWQLWRVQCSSSRKILVSDIGAKS